MRKLANIVMAAERAFLRAITHFPVSADRLPFFERSQCARDTHQFPFQNSLRKKLTDDEKKLSITPSRVQGLVLAAQYDNLIGKKFAIFQK